MFGVQIEDAAIARAQRQFFEMLWERAEPMEENGKPKSLQNATE